MEIQMMLPIAREQAGPKWAIRPEHLNEFADWAIREVKNEGKLIALVNSIVFEVRGSALTGDEINWLLRESRRYRRWLKQQRQAS